MKRDIIQIDEARCNGCGLCITACHEGALALVDGKARLVKDAWCDGLGACLPDCPTDALKIVRREADVFDETAVQQHLTEQADPAGCPGTRLHTRQSSVPSGCPGTQLRARKPENADRKGFFGLGRSGASSNDPVSALQQWPVQLKLVPAGAPFLDQAHLLIAADCTAYARDGFHRDFIRGRVTLIGCPKLDSGDYTEKLTQIFRQKAIKSIMVVRMEVPCCGGLEQSVRDALMASGKMIPWQVVTLSTDGEILDR